MHDKQKRIRYIRVLEKFFTRTLSLLRLENFDYKIFKQKTKLNYEQMIKTPSIDLNSNYLIDLKAFIDKTLKYLNNHSEDFKIEKETLLKDANQLLKEKNKNVYKKDKHKNQKFDDGY